MAQLIQQTLEQERWQREMIEQRYTQYTEDDEEVRGQHQPWPPLLMWGREPVSPGGRAGVLGGGQRCRRRSAPPQTGEYATDEEEEMSPMFPSGEMAIEVFELAENEDTLSPVEMDPEKLVHKFKEVRGGGECPRRGGTRGRPCQPRLLLQLQIKHAVTEAEIQQLKRKVSGWEGREPPSPQAPWLPTSPPDPSS